MIKEKCPVCGKEFVSLGIHFSKATDKNHIEYLKKINLEIDSLLLETDLYFYEIVDKLKEKGLFGTTSLVHKREVEICPGRGLENNRKRKMGDSNPARRIEVRQKISNTVAQQWKYGMYDERENGMLGKLGKLNPKFNIYSWLKNRYLQIYRFYHGNEVKCLYSGCPKVEGNDVINIHHIDEDRSNFLISNLEALCVFHHLDKHYGSRKTEFMTITKRFSFDASHNLLNYNGKCVHLHGHTYFLEVSIKKRIDLHTGMVMDFGDLKTIVKKYILDKLDHSYINDVIPYLNPTAENMVYWIWEILEKDGLLKGLQSIRLWETPDSYVELTKEGMYKSPLYVFGYYQDMYDFWGWEKEK